MRQKYPKLISRCNDSVFHATPFENLGNVSDHLEFLFKQHEDHKTVLTQNIFTIHVVHSALGFHALQVDVSAKYVVVGVVVVVIVVVDVAVVVVIVAVVIVVVIVVVVAVVVVVIIDVLVGVMAGTVVIVVAVTAVVI